MASIATVSGSVSSLTDDLLAEGYLFKETLAAEVVVRRFVRLYLSRFDTFHNFAIDPRDKRSWLLDRHCELDPKNADDIKTGKRYIRPGKVWSVTASLGAGNLKQVQLVSECCREVHVCVRGCRGWMKKRCVRESLHARGAHFRMSGATGHGQRLWDLQRGVADVVHLGRPVCAPQTCLKHCQASGRLNL